MNTRDRIRRRVLRGIALNRQPGFHFPGNFLDVSFDRVGRQGVKLSIDPGPWSADASGQTDLGALAILADLALGASIRAQLSRETRVATVSLSLQFGFTILTMPVHKHTHFESLVSALMRLPSYSCKIHFAPGCHVEN